MAEPIALNLPAHDPRVALHARLQNAPLEHAEALLAAYEVLQGLHDRGVFEVLRGALGSSDKVIEIVVAAAQSPESVRSLRNALILARTLGSIDPGLMEGFARSLPEALAESRAGNAKPPGWWGILKQFRSPNLRRGLVLVNSMLEAFGRNLAPEPSPKDKV